MLMAILLPVSLPVKNQNDSHFENIEISNTASIWPQIWKDYVKIIFFMLITSSMTLQGDLEVELYIYECDYRNRLSKLYMLKEDLNTFRYC